MRRALILTMLSLTACGSEDTDRKTTEPTIEVPAAPSSDFALPVTAPMAVRERLLHDLEGHNDAARDRASDLNSVIRQNR